MFPTKNKWGRCLRGMLEFSYIQYIFCCADDRDQVFFVGFENSGATTWNVVTLPKIAMYFKINWVDFFLNENMFCVLVVPTSSLSFLVVHVPSQSSNSCLFFWLGMFFFGEWYLNVPRNQQKTIEIYGKASQKSSCSLLPSASSFFQRVLGYLKTGYLED